MPPIALSALDFDKSDVQLHLRLLNTWKVGNPSRPDQFYAFGTLWVDAEELLKYPVATEPLANAFKSDIFTHCPMMSTKMPTSKDFIGESSTMSPFNAYSLLLIT